jgi:hypothetical protein
MHVVKVHRDEKAAEAVGERNNYGLWHWVSQRKGLVCVMLLMRSSLFI